VRGAASPRLDGLNKAIIVFSAVSFLAYGAGCFTSRHLEKEFIRYGFSSQRHMIGILQICGALALVAGWWLPLLGKAGGYGLSLMMFVAIMVRIRIRDSLVQTMPAIFYFLLNAWLALRAY
jgi:uncharacterized membrane protein YkgB